MIVRNVQDLNGTDRDVDNGNWVSRRFLLAKDGVGFSVNETTIRAGTETYMWYKHHIEAVYCVGGEGEIEDLSDGTIYPIKDGTIYVLNGHEKHILRARPPCRSSRRSNQSRTGSSLSHMARPEQMRSHCSAPNGI